MERRKSFVAGMLLLVSATMVYGTWLAADDMRAKPLVARVTAAGAAVRVENTGAYGWQDVTITVNGRYVQRVAATVEPGAAIDVPVGDLRTAGGEAWPAAEHPREVALTVTRRPRFPKVNRERSASGTFVLD